MKKQKLNSLRSAANKASRAANVLYRKSHGTDFEKAAGDAFSKAFDVSAKIQRQFHELYPESCPCSDCKTKRSNNV